MKIFLIGPGGVGKSTVGKILADKLTYQFLDLDEEFCKKFELIGKYIDKLGYEKYCINNSDLFFQLVNIYKDKDFIFALSSGFLVHENLDYISKKHLDFLNNELTVRLLPNEDKEIATKIVIERQLKRGFGLIKEKRGRKV